ncbi:MAG: serine--tRNA ligase, partial [Spirochaetaceae bacterium]|nr:serine--tRNA ligase [Spirochaetaceae bacterium]
LSELASEGIPIEDVTNTFPEVLQIGERGSPVVELQYLMSFVAEFVPFIPAPAVDGIFGEETERSLIAFQTYYGMDETGVADDAVFAKLRSVYRGMLESSEDYYLKNEAVFLEQALIMYALNTLRKHNFQLFITPDVAKEEVLKGIGFNPRGNESNVYSIEDEDTCLVATAEITLGGYHQDEILDKASLPRFYGGLSHCFRREAGAAGQFSKGLYRVHQFDKVEMFAYSTPEQSDEIHEKLRLIEEEIFTGLGLPFHVVDTCSGDLGAPAYLKWDLEAWMPGRNGGEYGEVTSTSNCTDYQARRLNIKYKDDDGKNKYVHTLNGTAIAVGRAMLAILENYQNADGSVTIPEVLVPYCGFDKILPKK